MRLVGFYYTDPNFSKVVNFGKVPSPCLITAFAVTCIIYPLPG